MALFTRDPTRRDGVMTNFLSLSISKMFRIKKSYRDSTHDDDDGNLILHDDVMTFLCRRTHTNWVFYYLQWPERAKSHSSVIVKWLETSVNGKRVEPDASTFSCLSERFCAMIRTSFFYFRDDRVGRISSKSKFFNIIWLPERTQFLP